MIVLLRAVPLPRFSHGTVEALKWGALALMTLDHIDAFVFHRELLWAGQLGRLVFPMFAVILAMNLARPDALASGVYRRVLDRLLMFGAIAQIPHGLLTGAEWGLFPLNVLATFAVFVGVLWLFEAGFEAMAALAFVALAPLVEYGYPGVALCLSVWWLYRQPSLLAYLAVGIAWASLESINGSYAALWAIPVLLLASHLRLQLPRCRWAFYGYYPMHLAAFWLLLRAL